MSARMPDGAQPGLTVPELVASTFVTADELAALLRVSRRTLFRLRATGDLPAPVTLARNIVRWRWSDITNYVNSLKTRKPRRSRSAGG